MGGCLSWPNIVSVGGAVANNKPSAQVISLNGDLRQYPIPVTVSQVLQSELATSSSSSSSPSSSCFVCNSDRLLFDDYIPSLNPDDELQAGQIYFVLPETKRHYKLSASDMAALAVKASVALQKSSSGSSSRRRKNKKARISPVINLDVGHDDDDDDHEAARHTYNYQRIQKDGRLLLTKQIAAADYQNKAASSSSTGLGVSNKSASVRKLQRYSSRRAKMAVRSFRLRLSTINEGSSVHQFT